MHQGEDAGSRDAPFVLPLDREAFADALAKGKGRVFLHVEEFGAAEFEDLIVEVALEHPAFDPECECGHGAWVGSLIEEAGCEDLAESALEHALESETEETEIFDADHRRGVLFHLARGGSTRAAELIETHLRLDVEFGCLVGAVEFVDLAGARAVIACSELLGELLSDDRDELVDDHMREFDFLIEQDGAARRIVEEAAKNSPAIARFISLLDAEDEEGDEIDDDDEEEFGVPGSGPGFRPHLDDILSELRGASARGESPAVPDGWYSDLDQLEQKEILDALVAASPEEERYLHALLGALRQKTLPHFEPKILELVDHHDSGMASRAMNVLERIRDPRIRARALSLLDEGDLRRGLWLLTGQFEDGDIERIRGLFHLPPEPELRHWVLTSLIGLFEANPEPAAADLLVLAYEHTPCSNCRARAAELLGRLGRVPDWMVEELVFDVANREED